MKYLKIGMIGLTISLYGMQKPYFRGNKGLQMWVPRGWRDGQLKQGGLVKLCADLVNYKDIDTITRDLNTTSEVIEKSLQDIIQQLGFTHILNNCREDRLGGNVLHIKTDEVYIATDWYMMVKYYYFGHHYQNKIRLASLIGLYDQNILLVPVGIIHEEGNNTHRTSLDEARIIYFEPQDSTLERVGKYKKTDDNL